VPHDCGAVHGGDGTGRPHITPDGPRRDSDTQFQREFGGNAFLTPGLVRVRHGGNQVLQFVRNPWTTGAAGSPPPEQPESLTVPAHERFRSHDDEELSPFG
jgi:hypothetical protein